MLKGMWKQKNMWLVALYVNEMIFCCLSERSLTLDLMLVVKCLAMQTNSPQILIQSGGKSRAHTSEEDSFGGESESACMTKAECFSSYNRKKPHRFI